MKIIDEWTKEISVILEQTKSGKMDLKEASVRIGVIDKVFKIYEAQLKYNKLRKDGGVHVIDFMECEFDDLPSSEQIKNAKTVISKAKEEIDELRKKKGNSSELIRC